MNAIRSLVILLAVSVLSSACVTSATGRRQLLLVTEAEEQQLGLAAFQEVLKEEKLSTDKEKIAQLERVGKRIAAAAKRPDFDWEFKLIDDDQTANAFCLPGGKIAVYTGILPITQTDEGLAAVIGHEVAHATLRHGGERMSQTTLASLGDQAIMIGMGQRDPAIVNTVRGVYGVGAQVGVLLPFSRTHEKEADAIGLNYMAAAGYDPRAAIAFWERMSKGGGAAAPEFLSTHPSHSTRIAELEKAMPNALKLYKPQQ